MNSPAGLGTNAGSRFFEISVPGFPHLRCIPGAEVDGRDAGGLLWKPAGKGGDNYAARNGLGEWKLKLKRGKSSDAFSLAVTLECRLRKAPKSVRLKPAVFQGFEASHVLTHGRKMGGCKSLVLQRGRDLPLISDFLIAITNGQNTLQLSHPLAQKDISSFSGNLAGVRVKDLTAATLFESCRGKTFRSAPVTITASRKGHDLLVEWATEQAGDRMPLVSPQESGWNSWDYYRWTITEEEVYKNAEFIAADPVLSRHVKRIIVDDGWQYCYGEWEPNSLFPSGMKKLARNLTRMGFTPGLWFSPTIAEPHSRLAQLNPETLAVGASGFPCLAFSCMERKGFLLDPTHPTIRRWWDELFRRYKDYGYRYFKLDFLAWTVKARQFADKSAGPGELMRHIVEPIRRAVGPESRILGCNFTLDGGPGLVDDVRVSSDIHSRWKSVKENVNSIAARFWAHERLWINDPDFTLCRGDETSDDPNLHKLKAMLPFVRPDDANPQGVDYLDSLVDLNKREAEVLLSLVITSGGAMNLSDNLPGLNSLGVKLLRKAVLAEKGSAAVPIDLFQSEYPEVWVQKLSSGLHRVLLINWKDRRDSVNVDLAKLNVPLRNMTNFWTGEDVRTKSGRLSVVLPAHSCLLAEAKI